MDSLIQNVRTLLQEKADPAVREGGKRFFKGDEKDGVKMYGVKTAEVRKIALGLVASLRERTRVGVFALCEELWKSGYLEETFVACEWSYAQREKYRPEDIRVFERWLEKYVDNWASCDTLCNHTIGEVVEKYPDLSADLMRWAESKHRWLKRGAAVSLIVPARKGLFLDQAFAISDRLIADPEDLVQKGYGWLLKAASEAHPEEVFGYLMAKRPVMPRTAFRYALEKMPASWRKKAMAKEKGKTSR